MKFYGYSILHQLQHPVMAFTHSSHYFRMEFTDHRLNKRELTLSAVFGLTILVGGSQMQ